MNIGLFTDTYFPQINGVTFTVKLWRDELIKEGERVSVYYPKDPKGGYLPKENEYPFRSIEFKFYKGYRIAFPTRITKKSRDLDIVHLHGLFTMAWAGIYVSRKLNLPRVLTYHTPADKYIGYITKNKKIQQTLIKFYNYYEKKLLNSCDLITCPSNVIRNNLLKKGIKEVITLSNGLDLNLFKKISPEPFKEKYGVKKKRVIGFCGRFGYEKHLEDIISIADDFDGDILLAGMGPAEDHYKKLAKGKKNIKILGFLDRKDLLGFYSSLDVFVFPSTAETQGLVALEANAIGVPVVGANEFALKETIVDGKTGYLYKQGDLEKLKELIEKTYENREKLSVNCLEYVENHSVENSMKKLKKLYNKIL